VEKVVIQGVSNPKHCSSIPGLTRAPLACALSTLQVS